jgi:tRNA(Glu) U13 pseudouridine synthase TruD
LILSPENKKIAIKEDTVKQGKPSVERTIIPEVEVLTEERAKEVSIYDVVFPLIGKSIKFPENEFGEIMREIMKED